MAAGVHTGRHPSVTESVTWPLASIRDVIRAAGLPILAGTAAEIARARELAANQHEVLVIDFPSDGQTTNDYSEFRRLVACKLPDELRYLGMALHGPTDIIRSLTKRFSKRLVRLR